MRAMLQMFPWHFDRADRVLSFGPCIKGPCPSFQVSAGVVCANDFSTPITVIKCEDVGAISLTLNYDPAVLTYTGYQNAHPALSIGNIVVNDIGGSVIVSWYTVGSIPLNILFGDLLEINWTSTGGYTTLNWDLMTPGYCEYADLNANILPATFVDGDITVNPLPAITADPVDVTVDEGQTATFSVTAINATNYTWEVSDDGGATWNTAGTGSTLTVTGITLGMDGYMYRCVASGICTPDAVSNYATLHVNPIITTILGTETGCAGTIIVPIDVLHFYTVASLSYTFGYNTLALSFVGVQDVHPTLMATGGIYLGGGIPAGIYEKLADRITVDSYLNKGRLSYLVEDTPLYVILDDHTALMGAAYIASES